MTPEQQIDADTVTENLRNAIAAFTSSLNGNKRLLKKSQLVALLKMIVAYPLEEPEDEKVDKAILPLYNLAKHGKAAYAYMAVLSALEKGKDLKAEQGEQDGE